MILTRIILIIACFLLSTSVLRAGGIDPISLKDQQLLDKTEDYIFNGKKDSAITIIELLFESNSTRDNDRYQCHLRILYAKYLIEVKDDFKPKLLDVSSAVMVPEWKNPINEYDYNNRLYRKVFNELFIAEVYALASNDDVLLGEIYYLIAKTNYFAFRHQDSIRYCYLAINCFEKMDMHEMKGATLFLLSSLYYSIDDHKQGEEVLIKSIDAYFSCGTPYCMGRGNLFRAKYYSFKKNSDSAIYYYTRAEKEFLLSKHVQTESNLQTVYLNLGAHYDILNDVQNCLMNFKKALAFDNNESKRILPILSYNLALNYYKHTDLSDSVYHYLDLCEYYTQRLGADQSTFTVYHKLSELYEDMGDYKKSLDYYKQYKIYEDSITKNIQLDSLLTFKLEFEYKKKEEILEITKQAELSQKSIESDLKHNNLRAIILGLTLSIGLITTLFVVFFIRLRLKRNIEENKQKDNYLKLILKAQYKERKRIARFLHDNCGASMAAVKLSMITMQSRPQIDNGRIDKLLDIVSGVSNDIRNLSHELLPQQSDSFGLALSIEGLLEKLLLPAGIDYQFDTNLYEENIGDEYEYGIYQVVVELTNNALKHSKANTVKVELMKKGNKLELIYKDDGIGKPSDIKKGVGQSLISAQLIALNGTILYTRNKGWLECSVVFIR